MIPVPHFFKINGISLALETVVAPCSSAEASVEKLRRVEGQGTDANFNHPTVRDTGILRIDPPKRGNTECKFCRACPHVKLWSQERFVFFLTLLEQLVRLHLPAQARYLRLRELENDCSSRNGLLKWGVGVQRRIYVDFSY